MSCTCSSGSPFPSYSSNLGDFSMDFDILLSQILIHNGYFGCTFLGWFSTWFGEKVWLPWSSLGISRGVWCFRLLCWFLDLRASYFLVAVSFWRQYEFHFIQPLGPCFRMEERCVGFLPSDVTFPWSRAYFIVKQCHIYSSAARSHLAIQRLIAIDGNHVRLQATISEVGIRWAIIEAWIDLTIWRIWIRPGCNKTSSLGFVVFHWEGGADWLIATWL